MSAHLVLMSKNVSIDDGVCPKISLMKAVVWSKSQYVERMPFFCRHKTDSNGEYMKQILIHTKNGRSF